MKKKKKKKKKKEKGNQLHSFWKTPLLRLKEVSEGWDDPVLCFEDGPADELFIFTIFPQQWKWKQSKREGKIIKLNNIKHLESSTH